MKCPSCSKSISGVYEAGSYACSGCGSQVQVNPAKKKNPGRKPLKEDDPHVGKAFEYTKEEADDLAKMYRKLGGRARVYKGNNFGKDGYFILWTMANPAKKKNPSFEYPPHSSPEFPGEGAGYARSQAGAPSYSPGQSATRNPAWNPGATFHMEASEDAARTQGYLHKIESGLIGDKSRKIVSDKARRAGRERDAQGRMARMKPSTEREHSWEEVADRGGAAFASARNSREPLDRYNVQAREEAFGNRYDNPNLTLTEEDVDTIAAVGGRYGWSDALDTYDVGDNDIPEHEAWEIRDAIDSDMEGGHDAFPMLDTRSELAGKLTDFYQSIENPASNPYRHDTSSQASQELFDSIEFGSRVTIRTPQGQEKTGKAVMKGGGPPPHHSVPHWVLDMGGKFGTPAVALPEDVVKVTKGRGKKRTLGMMRLTGDYRNPPFKEHKLEAKKKHWALEDNPASTQYSIRIKQQGSGAWAGIRYYDTKVKAEMEFARLDAPRERTGTKGERYMMAIFHGNKKIKQNFYDNPTEKMNCAICKKSLMRGDYIYGACHSCAKKAITKASKK